ncbi:hypothetical protein MTO96_021684 [Rhipicephalus appendiculatus]
MATEEPATPAKQYRRDATTVNATAEEMLVDSAQRLEPQWMVVRSTRAKKGHTPQRKGQRRLPVKGRRRSDQRDWRSGCPFKLQCRQRRSVWESC